jgi:hypothetical protein
MPCKDSSSSIYIRLDLEDRLLDFDFAKITCGREITHDTGFARYCVGRKAEEVIQMPFSQAVIDLKISDEERQFVLFLEWDCLRTALAQYLGIEHPDIDKERCHISEVTYDETGVGVAQVILPPKEMPKILPCSLAHQSSENREQLTEN